MVVGEPNINNIMGGIENTGSVRLHNHRKKLKQRFDIIKKLGQGTYGKVQLGINKETGQEVAIKTIKKSKIETEADLVRIRREIQIMSSVQHPNIIHIYEVFENREKMVLVMEYAAGGELYDYLSERKVLPEEEARRIFRQIATACYYCHKHKICHRDLKLENILLDEHGNAKIADFGLSNVFDDQRLLSTFCGSPLYASPEIVKGTPYQGPEVDCWSLGVLLYTLVYGAMPFDGSNFKRLVRQISQGDYFEPKKPSRASPLIRDMLTVNPRNRANIEKICAHWWVNECYDDSCLEISEELANQTPVRLDLLLSLAPPPPQLESEKLVVTGETADESTLSAEAAVPMRSHSVGSLMELTNPAERRIKDLLVEDVKVSPKRKLESTISTDQINFSKDGIKRKDKIVKENTIADITLHASIDKNRALEDKAVSHSTLNKSVTQTILPKMDVEPHEEFVDLSTQGAACTEIIEDAKKIEELKKLQNIQTIELPIPNLVDNTNADKENVKDANREEQLQEKPKNEHSKIPAKRKPTVKKVLTDKNVNVKNDPVNSTIEKSEQIQEVQPSVKPVERRRSRIFETAEKFQNMIAANETTKVVPEKPKKIVIPGVNVGGYKKEFERKASLTSTTAIKNSLVKKPSIEQDEPFSESSKEINKNTDTSKDEIQQADDVPPEEIQFDNERRTQVKNAVNIITNALDRDGTRKSKSRPCVNRKPPVPFGTGGRSASAGIMSSSSPPILATEESNTQGSTPSQAIETALHETPEEDKTSSAEITLKSLTLPRRKTTKAEITLDYPAPKPFAMGFKTEMAHNIEAPSSSPTQRTEAVFPVTNIRSASVKSVARTKPKERIIPISFEKDNSDDKKESVLSPTTKPPLTRVFQNQRSTTSQSLSRQSTQESDSDTMPSTPVTGEPIRKSPREYIIPIAVEGGGYVTPRAGSLEPSDAASTTSSLTNKSLFGRRRFDREGSEDESPFATLHKHSSLGRDSDPEDSRRDIFRMHSLRSSRPRKAVIEHNDSFSSGEEDDDDGFEILTAENLFSTLLSRVRDLTQRINVDGRPGFPTSRLLSSHFDRGTNFWNNSRPDMLSRFGSMGRTSRAQSSESNASSRGMGGTPWRRSVSRDLASDIETVFSNPPQSPPTQSATLPRGDLNSTKENLNLNDLDLKKLKLSEEDALALSYLTPGLSRRIQKQLLAQLAPSEARKLSRTLSLQTSNDNKELSHISKRAHHHTTLPRRFSVESSPTRFQTIDEALPKVNKSFLPVKSFQREIANDHCSAAYETPNASLLLVKPESLLPSPDSSISESISTKTDTSYKKNGSISSNSSISKNLTMSRERSYSPSFIEHEKRKPSRFLRSDFYNTAKDSNYYLKEKKEREMETQKVLKEIRDKRKNRFREHSHSREGERIEDPTNLNTAVSTDNLLKNVSDNIKNLESNVNAIHDYVNEHNKEPEAIEYFDVEKKIPDYVNISSAKDTVVKKQRTSKIARPKSYPTENHITPSKNSKLGNDTSKKQELESEEKQSNKNKFLQTIERKFEKLRSFSNSPCSISSEDTKSRDEKRSLVDDTIKRLREQSVPRNIDNCITESGLIKRAVSVEDLSSSDPKQLQASRKSVTKILNLFKKYEDKNSKKVDKVVKCKKVKDEKVKRGKNEEKSKKIKDDTSKIDTKLKGKEDCKIKIEDNRVVEKVNDKNIDTRNIVKDVGNDGQLDIQKTDNHKGAFSSVISNSTNSESQHIPLKRNLAKTVLPVTEKNVERPRSLLLDQVKQFQPVYNAARSDGNISIDTDVKLKNSKLPVLSFRHSLNLDNTQVEPSIVYKNSIPVTSEAPNKIPDRSKLKLDLSSSHPTQSISNTNTLKTDNFSFLSPYEDDISGDSWSVCSDYHNNDVTSPLSPGGNFYSADENESVSDRIRRKSFYTRFNEKKRPRKSTVGSYRDLDLYKDMNLRKASYGSLDRRTKGCKYYDTGDSIENDYGLARDDNVTMPISRQYPTYSPRIKRRSTSVHGPDSEVSDAMNEDLTTSKNRIYACYNKPSGYINRSSQLNTQATADMAPPCLSKTNIESPI